MGRVKLAVVLSSCAFGIIHMIPHQVFNATLLGVILGADAVPFETEVSCRESCSHFIYNAFGILHDRFGKDVPTDHALELSLPF